VKYYREYYSTKGLYQNALYDGTVDMLERLKKAGKTLVVATSKPTLYTNKILSYFGLDDYFALVSGAAFTPESAKKPLIIESAIKALNIADKSKVVMIGDREHDILGAKENGIASVGVLYGYGDLLEHQKAGATYIAKDQNEILDIIL
jgi:phosphoglycolate phosphatase